MRKFVVPRLQALLKKVSASSSRTPATGIVARSDNKEQVAESFETEITAIVDDLLSLPELVPDLIKEKLAEKLEEKKADTNPIGGPLEGPAVKENAPGGEALPPIKEKPAEPLPEEGKYGEEPSAPPAGEGEDKGEEGLPSFMKEGNSSFVYIPKKALASWQKIMKAASEGSISVEKITNLQQFFQKCRGTKLCLQNKDLVQRYLKQGPMFFILQNGKVIGATTEKFANENVMMDMNDELVNLPEEATQQILKTSSSSVPKVALTGMAKIPVATFMDWVGVDKDFVRIPRKVLSSWIATIDKHAMIPQAEVDSWYKEIASCVMIPKTVYAGWFEKLDDSVMFSKANFKNLLNKIESLAGLTAHKGFQDLKAQIYKAADDFSSDEVEEALNPVMINVVTPEPSTVKVEEVPAGQAAPLMDGTAAPIAGGCTCAEGTVCPTCSEDGSGAVAIPEGTSMVSPVESPENETMDEEIPDDVTAELTRVLENEASDPEDSEHEVDEAAEKFEKKVDKQTEELVGQMEKVMESALKGGMKTIQQNAKASAPATNRNCIETLESILFSSQKKS